MESHFLFSVFIFLAAACLVVPLMGKFKLGSVLGYLAAGVLIGPFGLRFIENSGQVLHFAEFGVVMMLFLIGLELEPAALWRMRRAILGLGGLQVLCTTAALSAIGVMLGHDWKVSLACGMALSLSSTALVLQMLEERGLLDTAGGKSAFSTLLFQDIAVIPILVLMPLLSERMPQPAADAGFLAASPGWLRALVVTGVIAVLVFGAKYLSRPLFRFIAKSNLREVFTATSLALIVGVALLMQVIGVSPALGAFVAGLVLANSEYRHTLEADLKPFKGLLLGLFFISIGMGMDFKLLMVEPGKVLLALGLLVSVKMVVLFVLGRLFGLRGGQGTLFAGALAQGGEFAFVLFQYALGLGLIDGEQSGLLTLTVALSMALTPFLMKLHELYVVPRFLSLLPPREYDAVEGKSNPVIVAGYGRVGQIVGRFLKAQGVKITVLEKDPDQIELLRRFGNEAYFGDASRLDLLEGAGAAQARLLVVAVDDAEKALEIVRLARQNFPQLAILARTRNRRHAYELDRAGADYFRRETFDASLALAEEAMRRLGNPIEEIREKARRFARYDEAKLRNSFEFFEREPELIDFMRQASGELERILQEDAPMA